MGQHKDSKMPMSFKYKCIIALVGVLLLGMSTKKGFFTPQNNCIEPAANLKGGALTQSLAMAGAGGATAKRFAGAKIREFKDKTRMMTELAKAQKKTATTEKLSAISLATMKDCQKWAVVTTIYEPADAIKIVGNELKDWCMVIVADTKTPKNYMEQAGWAANTPDLKVQFLSVDQQEQLAASIAFVHTMPYKSFARKNVGYLYAVLQGAQVIFDFDDDNNVSNSGREIMSQMAGATDQVQVRNLVVDSTEKERAVNPFPIMGSSRKVTWPRGFPMSQLHDHKKELYQSAAVSIPVPQLGVIQSVCDNDPDVDAIYRLTRELPFSFAATTADQALVIPAEKYAPYNAQATLHYPRAFWGLYLPITVTGRVSDIWRSYIVQRLMRELQEPLHLLYSPPMVTQYRNAHDYLGDMAAENHLYMRTEALLECLDKWSSSGEDLAQRILDLWIHLYERDYLQLEDVVATHEWLKALKEGGYPFPTAK